jgi:hypothetical protein
MNPTRDLQQSPVRERFLWLPPVMQAASDPLGV